MTYEVLDPFCCYLSFNQDNHHRHGATMKKLFSNSSCFIVIGFYALLMSKNALKKTGKYSEKKCVCIFER